MFRYSLVMMLAAVLLTGAAQAQRGSGSNRRSNAPGRIPEPSRPSEVVIQVRSFDDRPVSGTVQVELMRAGGIGPADASAGMSSVLASAYTDSSGEARLRVSTSGYFRVRVTGPDIEEAFSEGFALDARGAASRVSVPVNLRASGVSSAPGGMISVASLKVPGRARKENEKGMDQARDSHWPKAIEHFRKAIEAYPPYDAAYNNLGVAYYSSGDPVKAREAFAKAAELNPQNAKAARNLARILLSEKNYAEAKTLLERSLTVEPTSPDSLNLLASLFLQSGEYKEALASARKVHQVPHEGFAASHLIAASSLEHLHEPQNAAAELKIFLQESPNSPNAEQVRKVLSRLEAANRAAQ